MLCGVLPEYSMLDKYSRRRQFIPPRIVSGTDDFCRNLSESIALVQISQLEGYDLNVLPAELLSEGIEKLNGFIEHLKSGSIPGCNFSNSDEDLVTYTESYIMERFTCWWQINVSEKSFRPFFASHWANYQNFLDKTVVSQLFGEDKESLSLFEYENKDKRQIPFEDRTFLRYKNTTAALSYMVEIDNYMDHILKPLYKSINPDENDICFEEFEKGVNSVIGDYINKIAGGYSEYTDHTQLRDSEEGVKFKEYVCSIIEKQSDIDTGFHHSPLLQTEVDLKIMNLFEKYFPPEENQYETENQGQSKVICKANRISGKNQLDLMNFIFNRIRTIVLQTFHEYSQYISFGSIVDLTPL